MKETSILLNNTVKEDTIELREILELIEEMKILNIFPNNLLAIMLITVNNHKGIDMPLKTLPKDIMLIEYQLPGQ